MGFFSKKKKQQQQQQTDFEQQVSETAQRVIEGDRRGAEIAKSDIDLVKQFMDEHKGDPPSEIANRFFTSLNEDADKKLADESEYVKSGYRRAITMYQRELIEKYAREKLGALAEGAKVGIVEFDPKEVEGMTNEEAIAFIKKQVPEVDDETALSAFNEMREMVEQDRAEGRCGGCGGELDENGYCAGDGDDDESKSAARLARMREIKEELLKIGTDTLAAGGAPGPETLGRISELTTEMRQIMHDAGFGDLD